MDKSTSSVCRGLMAVVAGGLYYAVSTIMGILLVGDRRGPELLQAIVPNWKLLLQSANACLLVPLVSSLVFVCAGMLFQQSIALWRSLKYGVLCGGTYCGIVIIWTATHPITDCPVDAIVSFNCAILTPLVTVWASSYASK